jgi:hypothetical protein
VAIFNANESPDYPHPGAAVCLKVLAHTPWFLSEALVRICGAKGRIPSAHLQRAGLSTCGGTGEPTLTSTPPVDVELIQDEDILRGRLLRANKPVYHVLVVPGGKSVDDADQLGSQGMAAIRNFVHAGGGYCGICAGAALVLKDVHELWNHPREPIGREVDVTFSALGRRLLWVEENDEKYWKSYDVASNKAKSSVVCMRYRNGPLIPIQDIKGTVAPGAKEKALACMYPTPGSRPLPEEAKGLWNAAAFMMGEVGKGRVVLISPHPECSKTGASRVRRILQRAVLLAAAGPRTERSWMQGCLHRSGVHMSKTTDSLSGKNTKG